MTPIVGADPAALAEALGRTVRAAGDAILRVYASDFDVDYKADRSPVTEADRAAEDIILADLAALTPDIPVVAEEAASVGRVPAVGEGPFWLVDPLDGTKEFVRRNGEFTVNVGLVVNGRPVLGIVYAPALDLLYAGYGAGTAYREEGRRHDAIQCRAPGPDGLIVLTSRSHANSEALQAFLADQKIASVTSTGSSLKFCRIAEGAGDLYVRFGRTCEWDTCAGHAVLQAAGGSVTAIDGTPLLYGKPDFLNPHFIARGRAL